jgi:protein-L-isoaspartate(D-aspartate) O-methyltransferase
MFNSAKPRYNMVQQQIKPWQVQDETLLQILQETPRELFVPSTYENLAYSDTQIPLNHRQFMLSPKFLARALQAVQIQEHEHVLEIGTGTGYLTALISKMCQLVDSVELYTDLLEQADKSLDTLGCFNVHLQLGDAAEGWAAKAPYDVIIASGAYYETPKELLGQLTRSGRLFVVTGRAPAMQAYLYHAGNRNPVCLFETVIPYLENVSLPEKFVF